MPNDDVPLFLPGLEVGGEALPGRKTPLRRAVEQQLSQLHEARLLTPSQAGLAQLTLELADAVSAGVTSRRASAVAMAARELRETLLALPAEVVAHEPSAWERIVEELGKTGTPAATRPPAP